MADCYQSGVACYQERLYLRIVSQSRLRVEATSPGVPSLAGTRWSEDNDDDEGEIGSQDPKTKKKRETRRSWHSDFNTSGYSRSENVGGVHELQGCELCRDDAAVELDFRWWDRNRVLRLSKLLHHHQKSTGTRQSVVRVWESDRQLAGARESCQTLTSVLLVLLSSGLSKSVANKNGESTSTEPSSTGTAPRSINDSTSYANEQFRNNSETVETLFIPEDPNRYKQIVEFVRKLFERVGQSVDKRKILNGEKGDAADVDNDKIDRFSKVGNSRPSDGGKDEEKYSQRDPEGGVYSGTTVGSNGKEYGVTSMERKNYQPDQHDLLEAVNFGLDAMNELYTVKEPMLYSMGLYLDSDNPARHVAFFNDQTEEARMLAKYGYAVLQGATLFKRKFPNTPTDTLLSLRRSQSDPLRRSCPNRGVPDCPAASLRYRTSDGSCNNLKHLWWGSAMSAMERFLPPIYGDGIQSIRRSITGEPLPSPRLISAIIHKDKDVPLESVTHMLMQWGQFIDHDLTATGQSRGFNGSVPQCCLKSGLGFQPPEFMHPECLPIPVSPQDHFFGPLGIRCLEFARSGPAPKDDCEFGPREQLTQVTSYLDASMVYSSHPFVTDSLRLFRNGLLQYGKIQSHRPVLAKMDPDICRRGSLSTSCFKAGDGRLVEQPALTSLHVVFLRLHNRIATKLAALNAHWSDEKLFQESRRIVAAIVQHITYREFLPIVLGQDVMRIFGLELLRKGYYEGYDPNVNPTVANAFSTAAYRFGHSLVQPSFVRFDSDHRPIFNNVSIHDELANLGDLETAGSVDRLLLGLINQPAQRRDEHISEELTNHLFQTPGFPFGMDLASINIQRGRDHGIPPYVHWREPCALSPIRDFDDLDKAIPPSTASKFRSVYSSVEDIDLFTGGIAEKSVKGGLVGPTFACIIGQQFNNLRRGDRFWYENSGEENSFTAGQLQQIRRVTLSQVLCITMDDIETVQPFVFLTRDTLKNQPLPCNDSLVHRFNLKFWAEKPSQNLQEPPFRRRGILDTIKKRITSTGVTPPQESIAASSTSRSVPHQAAIAPHNNLNPPKASVHQQNRIVVKKPLHPSDNLTIVVQNNAINSPVFVNDAIYGSDIRVNPSLNQQTREKETQQMDIPHGLLHIPVYVPPPKPIPTVHPLANFHTGRPYVPYAFHDPNNPNPSIQLRRPTYASEDVVFDSFPGTSPSPTLYTYYTNFLKFPPGTRTPIHSVHAIWNRVSQSPTPVRDSSDQLHHDRSDVWQKLRYRSSPSPGSLTSRPFTEPASTERNRAKDSENGYTVSSDRANPVYRSSAAPHRKPIHGAPDHHGFAASLSNKGSVDHPDSTAYSSATPSPTNDRLDRRDSTESHSYYSTASPTNDRLDHHSIGSHSYYSTVSPTNDRLDHRDSTESHSYYSTASPMIDHRDSTRSHSYYSTASPMIDHRDSTGSHSYYSTSTAYSSSSAMSSPTNDRLDHRDSTESHSYYSTASPTNDRLDHRDSTGSHSYYSISTAFPTNDRLDHRDSTGSHNYYSTASPMIDHRDSTESHSYYSTSTASPTIDHRDSTRSHSYYSTSYSSSSATSSPTNDRLDRDSTGSHSYDRTTYYSTPAQNDDRTGNDPFETSFYHSLATRNPSKIHGATIVTEGTISEAAGYKVDKMEDRVTSEIPKPLVVRSDKNRARKPGQYYYDRNVLHRYPDDTKTSIDDRTFISGSVRNAYEQIIDGNENDTDTVGTMNQTRNEWLDGATGDDVDRGLDEEAVSDEIETVEPRYSDWLNPEEDSMDLSSVLEMPKIPWSGATAAKELPKPMRLKNYAF
ncbi:uncharacterized protein LOC122711243 [Apis laboriosa]|uniref:uncharacterized protein LOC122711243 n=1 Tax=Apis laboriosa TaxID=183418 RepID=UPI001CC39C92|nr:uncharacterized protein LOC122711243 [Apis laboriosa]